MKQDVSKKIIEMMESMKDIPKRKGFVLLPEGINELRVYEFDADQLRTMMGLNIKLGTLTPKLESGEEFQYKYKNTIERELTFEDGIISGEVVRDITEIFPEVKESFTQRKSFDEYYYKTTKVSITIESLSKLNEWYSINLDIQYLLIKG